MILYSVCRNTTKEWRRQTVSIQMEAAQLAWHQAAGVCCQKSPLRGSRSGRVPSCTDAAPR